MSKLHVIDEERTPPNARGKRPRNAVRLTEMLGATLRLKPCGKQPNLSNRANAVATGQRTNTKDDTVLCELRLNNDNRLLGAVL